MLIVVNMCATKSLRFLKKKPKMLTAVVRVLESNRELKNDVQIGTLAAFKKVKR